MAFGDLPLDATCKPNKGLEGGACNRQSCQAEPSLHFNHGSNAWYCADCARDIGDDVVNRRDWTFRFKPKLGYPQFETREQMDAREAAKPAPTPDPDQMLRRVVEPYFGWERGRDRPQSASLERLLKRARRRA